MEKIICAAIYYDDGKEYSHMPRNIKTGIVACGMRHHNCFVILSSIFPKGDYIASDVQGFLTTHDRFVERTEAFQIAQAANQIIPEMLEKFPNRGELYSEHLY